MYIITDYQRLKNDENSSLSLNWNMNREIAKINYRIHTDAIKEHLIVQELPKQYQNFTYATEADVLNVAMFGKTAKQWRDDRLLELNRVAKEQMKSLVNSAGVKRLSNTDT